MKFNFLIFIFLILLTSKVFSCDELLNSEKLKNSYAEFFDIYASPKGGYFIDVYSRDKSRKYGYSYQVKHECKNIKKINVLNKVAITSTTYIPYFESMSELSKIVAVPNRQHIYFKDNGWKDLKEIGDKLSLETIIKGKYDLLMGYSLENNPKDIFYQLEGFKYPTFIVHEFLERHPLGRVEWLKVFGVLFGKKGLADNVFHEIEKSYLRATKKIKERVNMKFLVAQHYEGSWFVPGRESYIYRLLNDIKADVLLGHRFKKRTKVSREDILNALKEVDVWLPQSSETSKRDLFKFLGLSETEKFSVFNIVNKVNKRGANDYWQTGVFRPDLILEDLIKISEGTTKGLTWYKEL